MFNRTNDALCLSHLFLFLEYRWNISYKTDLRVRMHKELPFEQLSFIPSSPARSDESRKKKIVLRLHEQNLSLIRAFLTRVGRSGGCSSVGSNV
jgi:hypothetical protein